MKAIVPILLFIAGILLIARGNPMGSGLIAAAGLLALVLLARHRAKVRSDASRQR